MANQLVLLQTRLPAKQAKKLDRLQSKAGVLTRAEFLRQIIDRFLESEEERSRN